MQKYSAYNDRMEPDENGDCYLVSEADARIAELEKALREIMFEKENEPRAAAIAARALGL